MTLKKYCLVALDMDGTITQHKTQLDTTNRRQLELLCKKYKVVIIGAGTCTGRYSVPRHRVSYISAGQLSGCKCADSNRSPAYDACK